MKRRLAFMPIVLITAFSAWANDGQHCETPLVRSVYGLVEIALREGVRTPEQIRRWLAEPSPTELSIRQGLNSSQLPVAKGLQKVTSNILADQWPAVQEQLRGLLQKGKTDEAAHEVARVETGRVIRPEYHAGYDTGTFSGSAPHSAIANDRNGRVYTAIASGRGYTLFDEKGNDLISGDIPRSNMVKDLQITFMAGEQPQLHILYEPFTSKGELTYLRHDLGQEQKTVRTLEQLNMAKIRAAGEEWLIDQSRIKGSHILTTAEDQIDFPDAISLRLQTIGDRLFAIVDSKTESRIYEARGGKLHLLRADERRRLRQAHLVTLNGVLTAAIVSSTKLHLIDLTTGNDRQFQTPYFVDSVEASVAVDGQWILACKGYAHLSQGLQLIRISAESNEAQAEVVAPDAFDRMLWSQDLHGQPLLIAHRRGQMAFKSLNGPTVRMPTELRPDSTQWARGQDNIFFFDPRTESKRPKVDVEVFKVFNEVKR